MPRHVRCRRSRPAPSRSPAPAGLTTEVWNDPKVPEITCVEPGARPTMESGAGSGRRDRRASSPWPARFPPPPPRPVTRRCSTASSVLPSCPTSRGRSSSPYVLGLHDAACDARRLRQPRDLPVPGRGAFAHARGLRPRGVPARLARAVRRVWPSAYLYGVGTPKWPRLAPWVIHFTAQYPACTFPCQRFAPALADGDA